MQQWSKKLLNLLAFAVHDLSSGLSCQDGFSFFFCSFSWHISSKYLNHRQTTTLLYSCVYLIFFFSPHTVWFLPYTLHRFGYRHNYILRDDEQRLILPSVCIEGKKIWSKKTFWDLTGLSFFLLSFHFNKTGFMPDISSIWQRSSINKPIVEATPGPERLRAVKQRLIIEQTESFFLNRSFLSSCSASYWN